MITYNITTRQYERDDGSVITAAELRAMFDTLDAETKKQLRAVSRKRENGDITTDQWAEAILAILVAAHIVSISLGKGGIERVTQADWDKVQEKIAWQSGYLSKWVNRITAGLFLVTAGAIAARAVQYAGSLYPMFANTRFRERKEADREMLCRLITHSKEGCPECAADEAIGWMPVSEMGEIGTRECENWCLCTIEFEDEV